MPQDKAQEKAGELDAYRGCSPTSTRESGTLRHIGLMRQERRYGVQKEGIVPEL